jgi:Zn finger protein HypA/HybF involved in hydrogenase expression
LILVCEKCKKETMSFDDGDGILVINFDTASIDFFCPKCRKENKLNLGDIQKLLEQKTRLPGIKGSPF